MKIVKTFFCLAKGLLAIQSVTWLDRKMLRLTGCVQISRAFGTVNRDSKGSLFPSKDPLMLIR